jgi:hypothetical protein
MSAQKFFKLPFANAGDVAVIPDPAQGDGSMSYQEGWGLDYERNPATDPAAKRISRDQMNQLFRDITDNLREYQIAGFPEFITTAQNGGVPFAYPKNAYVRYDTVGDGTGWTIFCSLVNGNTDLPTDPDTWAVSNPLTVAAVLASQADVNSGVDGKLVGPVELVRAAREGRWTFVGAGVWAAGLLTTPAYPNAAAVALTAGGVVVFTVPADSPIGPITLKVGALATRPLKSSSGDDLDVGDLTPTGVYTARYTGAEWRLDAPVASELRKYGSMGSGAIFGLITSNAAGALTTHLNVGAGNCRDSTNSINIQLVTPLTKRLDQVFAAGTGNGMRDTAPAVAALQTWHIYIIYNPTTRAVDILASQSANAPTLPAGYTFFRRIWAIMLDAAAAIRQYVQVDDWCRLVTRSADYAAQPNGGGVPYLRKVSVPNGIKVEAEFYFQSTGTAPTDTVAYLSGLYDPDLGAPAAFGVPTQWAQIRRIAVYTYPNVWNSYATVLARQFTDTAKNIYTRSSDLNDVIALGVVAWRDPRGKFF